jgi:hypothetical protein
MDVDKEGLLNSCIAALCFAADVSRQWSNEGYFQHAVSSCKFILSLIFNWDHLAIVHGFISFCGSFI